MLGPKTTVMAALAAAWLSIAPAAAAKETATLGPKTHTVYPGQTLGKIAKRYHVSIESICRVNKLRYGARIKPGQRLYIPEDGESVPAQRTGTRWQDFVEPPLKRGVVVLEAPTRRFRGAVVSPRGKVLPRSREGVEHVLASWRTGKQHEIDTRLIQLIVRLSDTFGGRPIRVVSGYREHSFADESKHKVGRAFDFSVPGIPNALMRDYLRTLSNVGVGYYPNSTHVHVDVREGNAYWVDSSAPGDPPRYAGRPHPARDPGEGDIEEPAGAATETTVEGPAHDETEPPPAPRP
jgi:uncharacterized protein YcbK (DUF882 family)